MEVIEEDYKKIVNSSTCSEVYRDPLETRKSEKNVLKNMDSVEDFVITDVKDEREEIVKDNVECCEIGKNKVTFDNSTNSIPEETTNNFNQRYPFILKDCSSDEFSDDSNDADFDVELSTENTADTLKKETKTKKSKNSENKKKSAKETSDVDDVNKFSNTNKPKKRRRTIIETILPNLIKQYKKYEILWQVDNISFGVKNKKYEVYAKILEELKIEQDVNISLEDINYHMNYLNELYSKDKEQELRCKMEEKIFVPEYELYTEMSFLSDSQGPFVCTICNEILPKYDSYCQHMAQHNGTQPFKCPSCDVTFTNYHKYLIHKKRHLGIYNFHCDICGKGYLFKNDLEWHVTSHTGDKPYLCQICGTGFRARHGYDNHIRRHEERFRYECHICKRGFNQLHALNNHVKSHLNIRDIICNICGKGFVHNKYLKRHQLIHGEVKNYKCNECGKAFFQACGLRAHRKNHHS
ncbi:zinc finger protein 69-like [Calliphora vicina]|uniref:zinc finger protein 69-like n=1 Tax=Calliphora vicina TaxID=7373 RepID=UPI00325B422B